jgi:hypothetical protein
VGFFSVIKKTIHTVIVGFARLAEIIRINICIGALTVYPYMNSLCCMAVHEVTQAGMWRNRGRPLYSPGHKLALINKDTGVMT